MNSMHTHASTESNAYCTSSPTAQNVLAYHKYIMEYSQVYPQNKLNAQEGSNQIVEKFVAEVSLVSGASC